MTAPALQLDDVDWDAVAAALRKPDGIAAHVLADASSLSALFTRDFHEGAARIARASESEPLNPVHALRFVLLLLRFGESGPALELARSLQEQLPPRALPASTAGRSPCTAKASPGGRRTRPPRSWPAHPGFAPGAVPPGPGPAPHAVQGATEGAERPAARRVPRRGLARPHGPVPHLRRRGRLGGGRRDRRGPCLAFARLAREGGRGPVARPELRRAR